MDDIDRRIIKLLQRDGRTTASALGDQVGLSASAAHRRIKLLEEAGVISGYVAVVNPQKIGLVSDFFIEIGLVNQSESTLDAFEKAVSNSPDIVECHLMTGTYDYLIKVSTKGSEDYERMHRKVVSSLPGVKRIQSRLILRTIRAFSGFQV